MLDFRRQFLAEFGDLNGLEGLEIGALDTPLIKRDATSSNSNIFYLDHLSRDELKEKYRNDSSVNVDEIVPVDFVCPKGDIKEAVNGKKFDYIIASHVIEHSPNLLQFFCDLFDILKIGGRCFLVIPDKRFTFDYNRPCTTFGMLLENLLLGNSKPNVGVVYDHLAMAIKVDTNHVWTGKFEVENSLPLVSKAYAFEAANRVKQKGAYLDVHVNIFTPYSFFEILRDAISHDIFHCQVEGFRDTSIGQLEFMVVLEKPENTMEDEDKSKYLSTLPEIELDNLLSPYMPQVKSLSKALEQITKVTHTQGKELEKLRGVVINEQTERKRIQSQLDTAQNILDRKSVKLVLSLVHKLCSLFPFRLRK